MVESVKMGADNGCGCHGLVDVLCVGWTRGMGGVKVGAISPCMPSTEEFVGRNLRDLYCTLFITFSKILLLRLS
jgi:hypothetical protein